MKAGTSRPLRNGSFAWTGLSTLQVFLIQRKNRLLRLPKKKCTCSATACVSLTHLWSGWSVRSDSLVPCFLHRVIRQSVSVWWVFLCPTTSPAEVQAAQGTPTMWHPRSSGSRRPVRCHQAITKLTKRVDEQEQLQQDRVGWRSGAAVSP